MNIPDCIYTELQTRKYLRTNLVTGETEVATVTNRNNLSAQKHLKILNLNDQDYVYSEIK